MVNLSLLKLFDLKGNAVSCVCYGNGHIHDTYRVSTDMGEQYILQRINHHVFKDIPALMQNIDAVSRHLSKEAKSTRHVLTLIPTKDGHAYYHDAKAGEYYRVYQYITDSICLNKAESLSDFYQSGIAFGQFQRQLATFPVATLHETIQRFHDTKKRFADFKNAVHADAVGRARDVAREIDFALAREAEAGIMVDMTARGELPIRVTHNDTKLNNVMLDAKTREALCVIDLDTVMPGIIGNDFGDAIRFGASTADEDERDLAKVTLSLPLFDIFTEGFLSACGESLHENEVMTLPLGAKLMTLECGIRFLSDYLSGDHYFHISRPEHNLDRCRTQFALIADMERQWSTLTSIVETRWRSLRGSGGF